MRSRSRSGSLHRGEVADLAGDVEHDVGAGDGVGDLGRADVGDEHLDVDGPSRLARSPPCSGTSASTTTTRGAARGEAVDDVRADEAEPTGDDAAPTEPGRVSSRAAHSESAHSTLAVQPRSHRAPYRVATSWSSPSTAAWRRSRTPTGGTDRRARSCRSCSVDRLTDGGRFLDVGCGTGATGAWLATRGELVAADFEPLALDAAPRAPPGERGRRERRAGAAVRRRLVRRRAVRDDAVPPVDRVPAAVVAELAQGRQARRAAVPLGARRAPPLTGPTTA